MTASGGLLLLLAAVADPPAGPVPGVRDPVPLLVDGQPVGDLGYLPHLADFDGKGRPDLLLGTRSNGRMRLARNAGKPGEPAFGKPRWFDELNPGVTIPGG